MEHSEKVHEDSFATITMVFVAESVEQRNGEWMVNFSIKKFPNKIWGNQRWPIERWNRVCKQWDFVNDVQPTAPPDENGEM